MSGPIKPSEVVKAKKNQIPEAVFEAFNELITKNFTGNYSCFNSKDVVALITSKDSTLTSDRIFKEHLLDIEEIYRKAGWGVKYDQPAYCENYDASFEFTKKKKGF